MENDKERVGWKRKGSTSNHNQNYAQAVRQGDGTKKHKWKAKGVNQVGKHEELWWGQDIHTHGEIQEWLKQSSVGKLKYLSWFNRLDEVYLVGGIGNLKLNYIGDLTVLIFDIKDVEVINRAKEED
ncbi:hypothetical protein AAZV13_01G102200 [Glycine max]